MASAILGNKQLPSARPAPVIPTPDAADAAARQEAAAEIKATEENQKRARGRAASILTGSGGFGDQTLAPTASATLLGI